MTNKLTFMCKIGGVPL